MFKNKKSPYRHIVQTYICVLMFINTDFVIAIVRKDSLFNSYTFLYVGSSEVVHKQTEAFTAFVFNVSPSG